MFIITQPKIFLHVIHHQTLFLREMLISIFDSDGFSIWLMAWTPAAAANIDGIACMNFAAKNGSNQRENNPRYFEPVLVRKTLDRTEW